MSRDRFIREMVAWLNSRVVARGVDVDALTPLFESRLIDSIRILQLIAWTERAIGRRIPDEQIRMDNFHSVERIADAFVTEGVHAHG